jgi:valyl-tRNA synthetase
LGIPFHHVVINTTILDGKGERMSKSKGNGVDPVDVIETHGADALRFTLTHMATETQDVRLPVKKDAQGRNTSDKFDLGSRFCNKIWQVAQFFVIANLENIAAEPVNPEKWSLADRWIVSRFNRTIAEADAALAQYRFDQYAKICYDFFYGDFCDWFVEAAKPALKSPTTAGQTASVLAAVLDGSLRLMHPMIPFITETIWQRLNAVRPDRSLADRLECPPNKRLILAAWPVVSESAIDARAETEFSRIRETSTVIRNLRNEQDKIQVELQLIANTNTKSESIALIQSFTGCKISIVQAAPAGLSSISTPIGELFFPRIDASVEEHRVAKRREALQHQITTLRARLSNESYTAKAPPHLVKQTRDQLAEAQAELAKLA